MGDFQRWANTLPDDFALIRDLAITGNGEGPGDLEDQLKQAVKDKPPGKSAGGRCSSDRERPV